MPRYDLMHWSQRVRDQQAAAAQAVPANPAAPQPPARPPAKPRAVRPKPPRDENAEHLLRLCREGRLFELQTWVGEGKSLRVPAEYRRTPLRVALDTGFHSLIEFLLQHEVDQATKNQALKEACWRRLPSVMFLALKYGANPNTVPFQDVIQTWDRDVVRHFLERGADPVTNAPFARAFKERVKTALGSFLDCKRARPDLAEALQEQADMALRQACQDENLKWVSLLMWLGANPRSKGPTTEDLDNQYVLDDSDYRQSALQLACQSRKPGILQRLQPDPAKDDLRELMAASASLLAAPETVAHLVSLGADINDKLEGGSTVLDASLRHLGWKETEWDRPYQTYHRSTVPLSRLGKSLETLRLLLNAGARWTPDERAIGEVRRALYRIDDNGIIAVIDLLRSHGACDDDVLKSLVQTPKMRTILAAADRRRTRSQRAAKSAVTQEVLPQPAPTPAQAPLPASRYDRQRLYDEVWAEPTQKVAQRYGVSDVAIAKACAQLDVPKPPRGYWAKKAAGQTLRARPPLPRREQ